MDPPTPFKRLGPVSRLKDFITPTEDVHALAHLGVARVDPEQWQLRIDGMVERPLVFDLEELLRFPARELSAVFECYGNPLEPDVAARSVANVSWRGVSLADLLARITLAGARPEGLFTTRLYNRRVEHTGREHVEPAQELDVNAVIVRPADQDRVPPGRHSVTGFAWSASGITRVEVSTDGGASWPESHVVARGPRRRGSASDSNGKPPRRAPTRFGLAPPTAGAGCNRTERVTPSTLSGSRSCNDTRSRGPVRFAGE